METILQLNRGDLHEEIKKCIRELLVEFKITQEKPLPDRVLLNEACEITGLSTASIYQRTMRNEIPVSKYGRTLVFSRKDLNEWMERRTQPKKLPIDEMTERLAKSAKKHLNKLY